MIKVKQKHPNMAVHNEAILIALGSVIPFFRKGHDI